MIRKIPIADLLPGMYVVDLHKRWLEHNIWRQRFMVNDEAHVRALVAEGIAEVSIDTERGADLPAPPPKATSRDAERQFISLAERARARPREVSLGEERRRAGRLLAEAGSLVADLMLAAQAGRQVDPGRLEPVIGKMIDSVRRNPDALVPLARVKQIGAYATDHAVATAALIIALGQHQTMSLPELENLALGTLLKDVGLAAIDEQLMTKRGMLSPAEYSIVQSHVEQGLAVLEGSVQLSDTAVAVVLEHHERFNGAGYPYRREGDAISAAGRMAAIVDSYDAMTSERPYRPAISPSHALRQLFDQGGTQFDPALVAAFIKTVGVFPVGTLVLLESGHLAVVDELHQGNPLCPTVRVIYHTGRRQYLPPVSVDLGRKVGNHYGQIVRAENYDTWGISALRWQPA